MRETGSRHPTKCYVALAVLLLYLSPLTLAGAKRAQHFTPADVLTATDVPYPVSTLAAGVVTLAVNLDAHGNILNVQTLRDIPTVTTQAMLALQTWTYAPATLNGTPVPSTILVNVVFDPAFLQSNNIPLVPPESFQRPNLKATSYTPPHLFTATFGPYPVGGTGSGAVVLDVSVSSTGKILQITALRDIATLTATAVAAVKIWSFAAAIYGNTPIASKVVVAMVFRNPATALP